MTVKSDTNNLRYRYDKAQQLPDVLNQIQSEADYNARISILIKAGYSRVEKFATITISISYDQNPSIVFFLAITMQTKRAYLLRQIDCRLVGSH